MGSTCPNSSGCFLWVLDDGLAFDRVAFEPPNTADSQKAGIDRWYKQQSHGLKLTALQAVLFNDKPHGMQGVSGSNPLGSTLKLTALEGISLVGVPFLLPVH